MNRTNDPMNPLIVRLQQSRALEREDLEAIRALPSRSARVGPHREILREGQKPQECCLLTNGYAARTKIAADGGRQIVSFHVAGDMLDLQHLFLGHADHSIQAITELELVWVPIPALRALALERPTIGAALWRETLIDASIFREWVLNVGRRDAKTRVAHLLCEFIVRNEAAGLGTPEEVPLPFTQEEIGDATGLTSVHVNRMLKQLTDDGLIERGPRLIRVRDWSRFKAIAAFDDRYLHLQRNLL